MGVIDNVQRHEGCQEKPGQLKGNVIGLLKPLEENKNEASYLYRSARIINAESTI